MSQLSESANRNEKRRPRHFCDVFGESPHAVCIDSLKPFKRQPLKIEPLISEIA